MQEHVQHQQLPVTVWVAVAVAVCGLMVTVLIGLIADWRSFIVLPPLFEALRRLVEAINTHSEESRSVPTAREDDRESRSRPDGWPAENH